MADNKYWLGLEELKQDPEFEQKHKNEFAEELPILDIVNEKAGNNPTSRRDFLKYLGFSIGAATLAASCEMPVKKAIPYVIAPEDIKPGIPNYYASTFADGSDYTSILVKTRDGRPIKIEGNKLSGITQGGTTARVQASVLSLYDTNRKTGPAIDGKASDWKTVDQKVTNKLKSLSSSGRKVVVLSGSILSPTTKKLIQSFTDKFSGEHITYDPVSYSGLLDANESGFGDRSIPRYHFDKADVIVSFGADFLGTWLAPSEFAPDYIVKRKIDASNPSMSRHIQIESTLTMAGSKADVRHALKPSGVTNALLNLYNAVAQKAGGSKISGVEASSIQDNIKVYADELWAAQGKSIVVSGSNNAAEQLIVNGINDLLGNYGSTLDWSTPANYKQGNDKAFVNLVKEMESGKIGALLIHQCNPAYDNAMADALSDAASKAGLVINFATDHNDSDDISGVHCPANHYLESWADAEPVKGSFSLGQPAIRNIFDTRQFEDSLLTWMQDSLNDEDYIVPEEGPKPYRNKFYPYLMEQWEKDVYPLSDGSTSFQDFWDKALHDGVFVAQASQSTDDLKVFTGDIQSAASKLKTDPTTGFELVVYEKVGIGNGLYFDNPWLQEMPDPITKATWDNYLLMSVADAKDMGLDATSTGQVFKIKANNREVELPVIVQPGMAKGTFAVALGYGRNTSGLGGKEIESSNVFGKRVLGGPIGVNMYPFVSFDETMLYTINGIEVSKTGNNRFIAQTQTHHVISSKDKLNQRTVVKEGILPALDHTLESIKEKREEFHELNERSLYPGHEEVYASGHHWKMSIDLNSCTGCGACVVACNAENNVPVVGRNEVARAHEMHWMRIDRYYTGEDIENPDVVFQPMMCQHCDNAPCENVCPVAATMHSTEGLNQMAYNRCIGTRYCQNNCPYKVRRFNWYDYLGADSFYAGTVFDNDVNPYEMQNDLTRMVLNPDVTIRSRGVMEKCSFCVQRLQSGKLEAKKEGRRLMDDDVMPACAQSCSTKAIKFGDYNNEESEVRKSLDEDGRTYFVIEEINIDPSVGYQAVIRNRSEQEDQDRKMNVMAGSEEHNEESNNNH
jgi:MoCo/4Fe-4S cofactor protein with predicted Tat translocation signal